MPIAYTVRCRFTDPSIADQWLDWLRREHLEDVCRAGAETADAVRLDSEPEDPGVVCEARYLFASREAFEAYIENGAPRLREEGLRLFPLNLGLSYSRTVGEVVGTYPG